MAKRFIDTGLFEDEWFFDLKPDSKIFWIYYLTKCDHAGLMKFNLKLIEFQSGVKYSTVIKDFDNRIIRVAEHLLFCPKFIDFQYPTFNDKKFAAANSAKELLIKNGIDPLNYRTVAEVLPNTLSKGIGNSNGNGNGLGNINNFEEIFENFRKAYPGSKGKKGEFERFKKHGDWQSQIDALLPALQKEINWRALKSKLGQFVPEWKNLSTWINKRCWEQELEKISESESKPDKLQDMNDRVLSTLKLNSNANTIRSMEIGTTSEPKTRE